ncbi:hypothetical protein Zmor_011191 [Zophobas morio]|uniref:Uncharacterized protein n=1 Tax=Zophobas morio TaxID=2755281 RepID=A0AA38IQJ8_9CUCU|nr:hypothetical protein Zmor_011191 [Zophobas morio]
MLFTEVFTFPQYSTNRFEQAPLFEISARAGPLQNKRLITRLVEDDTCSVLRGQFDHEIQFNDDVDHFFAETDSLVMF